MSKSFTKRLRLIVLALFSCVFSVCLVFGLSACSSSDKNKAEMTLGLTHTSWRMSPGDKDTLEVYVSQSDGKEYSGEYVWYSSDENIVSVTDNNDVCIVEAKSVGTARVTCEVGNYTVFCSYNIVDVTAISFEPESLTVIVGGEETVNVTVTMSDGSTSFDFSYGFSEDTDVVDVKKSGSTLTVTGLKAGSTSLIVTAGTKTKNLEITVKEAEPEGHVHEYEASGKWAGDYSTCDITLTCKNSDGLCDDVEVLIYAENVEVTETAIEADCTTAGSVTYTAKVTYDGKEYSVEKTIESEIDSTKHSYPDNFDESHVHWDWENAAEGKVAVEIKCAACDAVIYSGSVEYSTDGNYPGYWVAEVEVGGYTYSGSYKYTEAGESEETSDTIVEINFDSGRFTSGTVYVQKKDDEHPDTPTSASLTYNDGTETGFTAVGEASDSSTIEIATANASDGSHTVLKFNGGATTTKGSISIELKEGYYCVVLTYFQSNAGRWATVLDSEGHDLAPYIAEEDKTTSDSSQKTRTIYFYLDSAQNVYIGSHENGLYITSIGIYGVESVGEMIVEGVSLDVNEAEIVEGGEIVLTALVKLSDGKTYKGYDLVEYTWTSEPEGYVPENYTSGNITISGQGIGTVKVTVTVVVGSNVYSDNCVITVTEKVEEEIPELGEALEEIYIDFSVESTYSWIEDVVSGSAYTSRIMTFYTGTGSNMSISNGYLNTYGGSSTVNGRYFTIDLSSYEGKYITINVSFTGNGTSSRYLILATELVSDITTNPGAVLTSVETTSTGTMYTLSFSGTITADMATLYLTCSNGMRIYSVSVDVFEVVESSEPGVTEVQLSSDSLTLHIGDESVELKATAIMNTGGAYTGEYEWILSDSGIVEITGTTGGTIEITAIALGSVTITVRAGGKEASCEVKVLSEGEIEYEWVETYADLETAWSLAGGNSKKIEGSALTVGNFTFAVGIYFEDESTGISGMYDFNNQGKDVNIVLTGEMNNISFYAKTTSGTTSVNYYLFDAENESEPLCTWTIVEGYADDYYTMTGKYLEKGEYILRTSANARIGELKISEYLEESEPEGITATASTVDFLVGRTISESDLGIIVTVNYANGSTRTVTSGFVTDIGSLTLDFGIHIVTVTYSFDDKFGSHQFSDEITIYLYEVESIEISDFSMEYTGGTYYTRSVQKIFLVGDSVNYSYAAVTATAYYMDGGTRVEATFILYDDEVYFALYDENNNEEVEGLDAAGTYTVRATVDMNYVTGETVTATYYINVVTKEGADITTVKVAKDGDIKMDTNGVYTVNTINDAIQLIKLLGASDAERKFIYVGEGEYNEKVYIDIPNLSLIGSNPSEDENLATRSEVTEIVYDAMNGVMDPSGTTTYSTVGSATVTVASQATGFYAANITFRNYWNTNELYNEAKTITSSTQADAAYINADKAYFYNVTFTGYHDTLEAENGRQVYDHCYIEGRTDYIFGATATCYFKDCTIHSIGAGTDESNGGYVVAYKGNGNAGTVTYGYIFDGCTFEGDENVKEHSVALGRAWGEDMMMVIMNSTFDASFAMGGYTGATSALRYCQMNYDPDFTKIFEYNNTGDSAIGSGTSGYSVNAASGLVTDSNGNSVFTIPSEEKTKDFADMTVIFAATNGTVNYGSAWDGKCDVITITVMDSSALLATIYGTGSMSVSDLKEAINVRLEDAGVDKIYVDSEFKTELTGSITSDTTVYISIGEKDMTVPRSVTYNFGYGAEDVSITESGYYGYLYVDVGNSGSLYSNGTGWSILAGDATITVKLSAGSSVSIETYDSGSLAVNGQEATGEQIDGENYWYTYTAGYDGEEVIISCYSGTLFIRTIEIEVPVIYRVGDSIDLSNASGVAYEGGTGEYEGLIIDATNGKFVYDSAGQRVQVNSGTVIKIPAVSGATAEIIYYSGSNKSGAVIEPTDDEGCITVTFGENTYICGFIIVENPGSESEPGTSEPGVAGVTVDKESLEIYIEGGVASGSVIVTVTMDTEDAVYGELPTVSTENSDIIASVSANLDGTFTVTITASVAVDSAVVVVSAGGKEVSFTVFVKSADEKEPESEEPGDVEIVISEAVIRINGIGKEASASVTFIVDGEEYSGNEMYSVTVTSGSENAATVSYDANLVTVRSVSVGGSVITVSVLYGEEVVATASITVIVTSSEEDENVVYSVANSVEGGFVSSYSDPADASVVSFGFTTTSYSVREKATSDGVYFSDYAEIKDYSGRHADITIADGYKADITVYVSHTSSNNSRTVYLSAGTAYDESTCIDSVTIGSGGNSTSNLWTLRGESLSAGTYHVFTSGNSDTCHVYAIVITYYPEEKSSGDDEATDVPEDTHVYPDSNDTVNVVWDWEGRNETSNEGGYVSVAIICVVCGETIISEEANYTVDENNPSYWYAEVSEGGTTYASMYRIPGEGSAYIEESFMLPVAGSEDGVSGESFAAGTAIEDNNLFTLTAIEAMQYSAGATYGNINGGSAIVTFTDMSGVTQNPDQGIQMVNTISASGGTKDSILTFTAKENIRAFIYVSLGDNGFTGNRSGDIFYSMGGAVIETMTVSARNEIFYIQLDMQKGQSLTIGATNNHASSTGKLWLWGAEAYTLEGEKIEYGTEYKVTFNTNQTTIDDIVTAVYNYSVVSAPVLPGVTGYYFAGWYMNEKCTVAYDFSEPVTCDMQLYAKWVELDADITYIEGAYESIALEFTDTEAKKATIYYKMVSEASYIKMTDSGAVWQLDSGTVRVDIMGLCGDEYYNIKILTSGNVEIACYSIYVASYDRSGYAHFNYDKGVGAYEDDGTLKNGALVIYVTEDNKNDVTNDVYKYDKETDSYSRVEWTELSQYLHLTNSNDISSYDRNGDGYVRGIGEILNNSRYSSAGRSSVGIAALCDAYGAVDVRIVGEVKASVTIVDSYEGVDGETGETMTLYTGYYDIIGLTDLNATTNGGSEGDNGGLVRIRNAHDVTIEGLGEGALLNGWGISIVADSNATNGVAEGFEVRNLTFKNSPEDAIGMEGKQSSDNTKLDASLERCWIHNNSFYIGHCDYPAESDKGDGDGTIDFKRGQYLTISYNYFEGCHKTILLGSNASSLQYNISMHHNYWYECQQRMPLVRNANVHFYNNYINGNSDENLLYVTSVRANSYVYAEYNYYENCRSVCLVVEENGAGGVMKSYMNVYDNCYGSEFTENDNDVDESVRVTTRTEYVENNCKDEANGIDYSSFDTNSALFYYDAEKGKSDCYLTSAAQAKEDVIRMAGAFSSGR